MIAEGAPQLGWGRWTVERRGQGLEVIVTNSPFATGYPDAGRRVCAPIAGMLGAVASLSFGRPMAACETACTAAGHKACHFVVSSGT
jgi:predicted hydrocarbon binding protein